MAIYFTILEKVFLYVGSGLGIILSLLKIYDWIKTNPKISIEIERALATISDDDYSKSDHEPEVDYGTIFEIFIKAYNYGKEDAVLKRA